MAAGREQLSEVAMVSHGPASAYPPVKLTHFDGRLAIFVRSSASTVFTAHAHPT
jgi:hypothetical protein